jgi:hypothetical protein
MTQLNTCEVTEGEAKTAIIEREDEQELVAAIEAFPTQRASPETVEALKSQIQELDIQIQGVSIPDPEQGDERFVYHIHIEVSGESLPYKDMREHRDKTVCLASTTGKVQILPYSEIVEVLKFLGY